MADSIILAWTVDVANTPIGPVEAATKLAAVSLYAPLPDPVLGQAFGLTVASDSTSSDATSATRTLTLNMTPPNAPPFFPCHPITSTPPNLADPYPLVERVTLPGSFFVQPGATSIPVTDPPWKASDSAGVCRRAISKESSIRMPGGFGIGLHRNHRKPVRGQCERKVQH